MTVKGAMLPYTNQPGYVLISKGDGQGSAYWAPAPSGSPTGSAGGDLTGSYPNPTIGKIDGVTVAITSLTSGQVLTYNGTDWVNSIVNAASIDGVLVSGTPSSGQFLVATSSTAADWQTVNVGNATEIQGVSISLATLAAGNLLMYSTFGTPEWTNTSAPTTIGQMLYWNGLGWEVTPAPGNGQTLAWNSSTSAYVAATVGNATEIQGVAITITSPSNGQVLTYQSGAWVNSIVNAASIDGVLVSGTPSSGQFLVATSSTAADWQSVTLGNATEIQGVPITISSLFSGAYLGYNGTAWVNTTVVAVSGVVFSTTPPSTGQVLTATSSSGASWQNPSANATEIQGVPITITSPTAGQYLYYTGSAWVNSIVNAASIDGVLVSGTPSSGQVLTATSSSAADWQTLPASTANNVFGTTSVAGATAVNSSSYTALETLSVSGYTKYAIFFNFGQSAAATAAAQVNVRIQDTTASATAWGPNGVGQVTATTTDRASFSGSCSYTAPSTGTRTLSLQVELGSGSSSMSFGNLSAIGIA